MKRIALATLGLVALAVAPAAAADLGPTRMPTKAPVMAAPIVYNWSGFYIGAHVGGGWSSKDWTWCPSYYCYSDQTAGTDPSGFLGGVQAGFNWQAGQWVFGVEGQVSWSDLNGSSSFSSVYWTGYSAHTDINFIATLAGRVGWAFDRTLLYVKGGVAWADEDHWVNYYNAQATNKSGSTRTGWMVGVGIEHAFWNNWSAKLEYNYMDFGSDGIDFTYYGGSTPWGTFDIDQQIHVVKFGVNYRFGGPVVARY